VHSESLKNNETQHGRTISRIPYFTCRQAFVEVFDAAFTVILFSLITVSDWLNFVLLSVKDLPVPTWRVSVLSELGELKHVGRQVLAVWSNRKWRAHYWMQYKPL